MIVNKNGRTKDRFIDHLKDFFGCKKPNRWFVIVPDKYETYYIDKLDDNTYLADKKYSGAVAMKEPD